MSEQFKVIRSNTPDDSADASYDPPEDYREYGDPRRDAADAAGMPLWEKIR